MTVPYSYRIVRYVHDPAAGETLNVGVVLYAPSMRFLNAIVHTHYERLSKTFSNFQGDDYRHALRRFELAVDRFREQELDDSLLVKNVAESLSGITARIWPDENLSFRLGPVLSGITDYA